MRVHDEWVPAEQWRPRCRELVAAGATYPDFLTAVDRPATDEVEVVLHLVDLAGRRRHLLRTSIDRGACEVDSLVDVVPGLGWHEREVHEMFGVVFRGNPDLRPLLTTDVAAPPLLRTTPLPARLATPWPGASDPADRPAAPGRASRPRSAPVPPGIPTEWSR